MTHEKLAGGGGAFASPKYEKGPLTYNRSKYEKISIAHYDTFMYNVSIFKLKPLLIRDGACLVFFFFSISILTSARQSRRSWKETIYFIYPYWWVKSLFVLCCFAMRLWWSWAWFSRWLYSHYHISHLKALMTDQVLMCTDKGMLVKQNVAGCFSYSNQQCNAVWETGENWGEPDTPRTVETI